MVLLGLCSWGCKPRSGCKHGSPGRQDDIDHDVEEEGVEEEDDNDDDDCGDVWDLGRCVADRIQSPVSCRVDACKLVEELVDELLTACQRLSRRNFKPRLQPAIRVGCVYEGWSARQDNVLYRLLVPLLSPPGHVFCLETGTTKDVLNTVSCLRVQLHCMCLREQLLGDMLSFVHHSKDELKSQGLSLLNTLCTSSYLDIEKTASWFQMLVKDTWKLMPLSHSCQLTLLPTTHSCNSG